LRARELAKLAKTSGSFLLTGSCERETFVPLLLSTFIQKAKSTIFANDR